MLALDLGTKMGWAHLGFGLSRHESGQQDFTPKRGESPGMRYMRFNRWLDDFARVGQRHPLELIVYEQTRMWKGMIGGSATEIAAGFATRVQEYAARYGIEHVAVNVATLKKWVTGDGQASKDDMHAVAVRRGWVKRVATVSDDEVDAVCLLYYALAEIVPAK